MNNTIVSVLLNSSTRKDTESKMLDLGGAFSFGGGGTQCIYGTLERWLQMNYDLPTCGCRVKRGYDRIGNWQSALDTVEHHGICAQAEALRAALEKCRRIFADNSMEFAWLDALLAPHSTRCVCQDGVRGAECVEYHPQEADWKVSIEHEHCFCQIVVLPKYQLEVAGTGAETVRHRQCCICIQREVEVDA